MSCYSKEKINKCDYSSICKSHSAKSDRELYRICPSKLSKRELEDLYFALLENNLELKQSINGQHDKIRTLTTKVQRMTAAQRIMQNKEMKDCCIGTKAVVSEQRESIQELKRMNNRLAEKVRQLNMRLCSAKQFCRKSSPLSTTGSRSIRCTGGSSTPKKQSNSPKTDEAEPKISVSCQNLDKENLSLKSAKTDTRDLEGPNEGLSCDENKCVTATEDLKLKIVNLQDELIHTHADYSTRITRLETEVSDLRKENFRVRSEREASEHELIQTTRRTSDLLQNLRMADARCVELMTNLAIERRKVVELETQLKSATMSDRVNKTIEEHLISRNETQEPTKSDPSWSPPVDHQVAESPSIKKVNCFCPTDLSPEVESNKKMKCICECDLNPEVESKKVMKNKQHDQQKEIKCICECDLSPVLESKKEKMFYCECPPQSNNSSAEITLSLTAQNAQLVHHAALSPVSQNDSKMSKGLNDSGYAGPDTSKSPDAPKEKFSKMNQDLMEKIGALQNQVDTIKSSRHNIMADSQNKPSDTAGTSTLPSTSKTYIPKSSIQPLSKIGNLKSIRLENSDVTKHENSPPKSVFADDQSSNKPELPLGKRQLELIESQEMNSSDEPKNNYVVTKYNDGVTNMTTELGVGKNTSERDTASKESLKGSLKESEREKSRQYAKVPRINEEDKLNQPETGYTQTIPMIKEEIKLTKTNNDLTMPEIIEKTILEYDKTADLQSSNQDASQADTSSKKLKIRERNSDKIAFIGSEQSYDPEYVPANREACEYCAGCTYEKECETKSTDNPKNEMTYENYDGTTSQITKSDRQMSDTTTVTSNMWKQESMDKLPFGRRRRSDTKINNNKQNNEPLAKDMKANDVVEKPKEIPTATPVVNYINDTSTFPVSLYTQIETKEESKEDIKEEETLFIRPQSVITKDSFEMNRNRLDFKKRDNEDNISMPIDFYDVNGKKIPPPKSSPPYESNEQETQSDARPQLKNQEDTLEENAAAAEARRGSGKRDVSVYRRRSGTLCFRTLPAGRDARLCYCDHSAPHHCRAIKEKQDVAGMTDLQAFNIQPATTSGQATRSEADPPSSKHTRGTSPDNTECEISSMTDLPSERDELSKNPNTSRATSPGEDKATTTYTDSSTSPAPNTNYTLSEGELPAPSGRRLSNSITKQDNASSTMPPEGTSAEKMEAALQAITEELSRCKNLLLCQRPQEVAQTHRDSTQSQTGWQTDRLALHRGVATQSIGDAYAPKCNFTLHIGTVVLSDEAVVSSRNKNMVLTWKFYDQNIAMTRMRAGRVVLFDFSTEYDIKISDRFLDYMKHEEMPIVICELDKPDEPFASCKLPLRDALLHTNRRADMSLALLAGPRMLSARAANNEAADALDAGDEMGVIDLWCVLRADGKQLPIINSAIARASPPMVRMNRQARGSRILQQVMDDDPSNEFADLDLRAHNAASTPLTIEEDLGKNMYKDAEFARSSVRRWGSSLFKFPTTIEIDKGAVDSRDQSQNASRSTPSRNGPGYDPSKYPPAHRQSSSVKDAVLQLSSTSQQQQQPELPEDPERETSEIIVNEVATKIKSPEDMRQVLQSQDYPRRSSLPPDLRRSSLKNTPETPPTRSPMDLTNMDAYRKYQSTNRTEASKKSVTIVPKYIEPTLDIGQPNQAQRDIFQIPMPSERDEGTQPHLDITVLWLALNEECEAMVNPHVQRVYVAYSFLGRNGAELETPISLPKPKHYVEKCYFNFKKSFALDDRDYPILGHMARCRASRVAENSKNCIIFSVVSEPPEDPLGLESCEDIGFAYLYLGDVLAYSADSSGYTEVIPVRSARGGDSVCGVLAVRLDGLDIVRRCLLLSNEQRDLIDWA